MFHVPNKYRLRHHRMPYFSSVDEDGNNGMFVISFKAKKSGQQLKLYTQASDGMGWEHVSVSIKTNTDKETNRCPTWEEMCFIKDLFWDSTDCVIQFHPPESEHISMHHYTLHLWRKVGSEFETPLKEMVGINL